MNVEMLTRDLEDGIVALPSIDIHTHLVGGRLSARGLHDVLLYHMIVSDLYAAGCPNGARLSQYPLWATREEATFRIEEALPYLSRIRNTSTFWMLRTILEDLYGWTEPIDADNWRRLDDVIRERADDRAWSVGILDRLNIRRTGTELARRGTGEDDDILQYALEWGFFTRCQWGEFDTALYELERCWGKTPESPSPIGGDTRSATDRHIRSLADVHSAIDHYLSSIPYDLVLATATHISTDLTYREVSDAEMEVALSRRSEAGPEERDIYASYVNDAYLSAVEASNRRLVFQFSFGAEPLPYETGSRISQQTLAQLAQIIARHPKTHFQCFLASRHANQSICTMARELPNLSVASFWWHNVYPDVIRQVISERLDMLPMTKQIGFFSDAYCVEWVYGKAVMARKQLAQVLAGKIAQGQYSRDDAIEIARAILFDSPQHLLGMTPKAN